MAKKTIMVETYENCRMCPQRADPMFGEGFVNGARAHATETTHQVVHRLTAEVPDMTNVVTQMQFAAVEGLLSARDNLESNIGFRLAIESPPRTPEQLAEWGEPEEYWYYYCHSNINIVTVEIMAIMNRNVLLTQQQVNRVKSGLDASMSENFEKLVQLSGTR
jgi:hypothetical protein